VIFHSAATVRFDERLDIAIGINVIGAREVVKLAHKMENLKVLNISLLVKMYTFETVQVHFQSFVYLITYNRM